MNSHLLTPIKWRLFRYYHFYSYYNYKAYNYKSDNRFPALDY
jgi:hypothetical protein